uniref:Poly [ADP-ribose] polymerase n=1 Tax=Xiphophorus couchianus TaxID=32473 RepID=A0A3B5M7W1_9TELE
MLLHRVLRSCSMCPFLTLSLCPFKGLRTALLCLTWRNMFSTNTRKDLITKKLDKIERIQNPGLWKSLQIKKQEMELRNNHQNNDKRLFHGTTACYGNGSYFAVKADYSAQDTYSKPNANGEKFMYVCRVLTGDYTLGEKKMVAPPSKGSSSVHMYDSVVDDMATPSMFVVFHDTQAYPEYLITFK